MFPIMINGCLRTLLIVVFIAFVNGQDRKLISILNPGCQSCTSNSTLMYVRAVGSNDTIHQIWDFSRGSPTIIYAIGSVQSRLYVSWNNDEPISFKLSEEPLYSFAVVIDKLIEYNDTEDVGSYDNRMPHRAYPLWHMLWKLNDSIQTDKEVMVRVHGHYTDGQRTGIVDVKLDLLPYVDYAAELPRLIHTANSSLLDVSLVNLTSSRDFNSSRFALHAVLASTDRARDSMHYSMRKSLDDEHTPGVFEIIEVKTPRSYASDDGGYIQFRPVGYTEPQRSVSSSTNAHISAFNRTILPHQSTVRLFYERFDASYLLVEDMVISFGSEGDGFYKQHNYTSWSCTIGYGAPPIESVSLFVVLIICVGLGVPVLLAASALVVLCVRRIRRARHQRLVNEE